MDAVLDKEDRLVSLRPGAHTGHTAAQPVCTDPRAHLAHESPIDGRVARRGEPHAMYFCRKHGRQELSGSHVPVKEG